MMGHHCDLAQQRYQYIKKNTTVELQNTNYDKEEEGDVENDGKEDEEVGEMEENTLIPYGNDVAILKKFEICEFNNKRVLPFQMNA